MTGGAPGTGSPGPLRSVRVVVTRPRPQAAELAGLLEEAGAEVIRLPTIAICPPESWGPVDAALRELDDGWFEWVLFTSANGVDKLFERWRGQGTDPAALTRLAKVAAVGRATARLLREYGVEPDVVPSTANAEALARAVGAGSGPVLWPRAAEAGEAPVGILAAAGWTPYEVAVYRTVQAPAETAQAAAVRRGAFDVVTFTSGSAVRAFIGIVGPPGRLGLARTSPRGRTMACLGPATTRAARAAGLRVDVVAGDPTTKGLVDALIAHLRPG